MMLRTVERCPRGCQPALGQALRYGPTPTPIPVRICWECGYETPALDCCTDGWRQCPPCGKAVYATLYARSRGHGTYCSTSCASKMLHAARLVPHQFKAAS